jgi:phosphatidate cytidylyltransferase
MSFRSAVLIRRVLTVLVILPLFLTGLFLLPQPMWGGAMLVIVLLAAVEWSALAALDAPSRLMFIGVVLLGCLAATTLQPRGGGVVILAVALVFWLAIVPLWLRGALAAGRSKLAAAGVVVLASSWYALYVLQEHPGRLLVLLAIVWIADSAAYFAGRRYGRRKLAPTISPGKTWEGVAGAALGVGVYYVLLWWVWAPAFLAGHRVLDLALVAGILAVSVEGDLFESWMKRRIGVKDSGTLLPGHGGVLDRIDGVVAALPLAALGSAPGWN